MHASGVSKNPQTDANRKSSSGAAATTSTAQQQLGSKSAGQPSSNKAKISVSGQDRNSEDPKIKNDTNKPVSAANSSTLQKSSSAKG